MSASTAPGTLDPAYTLAPGTPSPQSFCDLRVAAGMSPRTLDAATRGLPHTLFGVIIHHGPDLVGMGRIVGDGALIFYVSDIAVHPAHQRRGLGKAITAALVRWLEQNAPATSYISLHADGDARHLYAQFGFTPTGDSSIGMQLRLPRQA